MAIRVEETKLNKDLSSASAAQFAWTDPRMSMDGSIFSGASSSPSAASSGGSDGDKLSAAKNAANNKSWVDAIKTLSAKLVTTGTATTETATGLTNEGKEAVASLNADNVAIEKANMDSEQKRAEIERLKQERAAIEAGSDDENTKKEKLNAIDLKINALTAGITASNKTVKEKQKHSTSTRSRINMLTARAKEVKKQTEEQVTAAEEKKNEALEVAAITQTAGQVAIAAGTVANLIPGGQVIGAPLITAGTIATGVATAINGVTAAANGDLAGAAASATSLAGSITSTKENIAKIKPAAGTEAKTS